MPICIGELFLFMSQVLGHRLWQIVRSRGRYNIEHRTKNIQFRSLTMLFGFSL